MIQLSITKTSKGYGKRAEWMTFDHELKSFPNIQDAKTWIKTTYGKAKSSPMFIDTKEGKSKKVGYVIGFHNADFSHAPIEKWIQRDWVEFREVKTVSL